MLSLKNFNGKRRKKINAEDCIFFFFFDVMFIAIILESTAICKFWLYTEVLIYNILRAK